MTTQPTERPDGNQLLLTGGKAPEGADFGPTPPGVVEGRILGGPTTYHAREFDRANPGQGPLRYWPDGNPVYGVYLDLDTAQGIRRLYVEKLRMTSAIQAAMLRAGVHRVDIGGHLSVMWTGTEVGQGNLPANTYVATYAPPSASGNANLANAILGNGGAVPAQAAPPATWQQGVPGAVNGAATPVAPVPAAPVAPPVPVQSQQVLTETIAAAMRNAGIPTDGYTIVPG